MKYLILIILLLASCDRLDLDKTTAIQDKEFKEKKLEMWNGPCADEATLLITSSGYSVYHICSNKLHKNASTSCNTPIK